MGFTKYRVRMLYFYEALIMVLSSCILGVLIGVAVGYNELWGVNEGNVWRRTGIHRHNPMGDDWEQVHGELAQVAVSKTRQGAPDVWGVNGDGLVYHYNTGHMDQFYEVGEP